LKAEPITDKLAHHREGACGRRPAAQQVTVGSCGRTELDP